MTRSNKKTESKLRVASVINCSVSRRIDPVIKVEQLPDGLTQDQAVSLWASYVKSYKGERSSSCNETILCDALL